MTAEAAHVYAAITAVTLAMSKEGITKGRKNEQQGYKFRGIDDVYNVLSTHLAAQHLCILPRVRDRSVTERPTKSGGVSTYVVLTVDFDFVSSIDGSKHTVSTMGEAMDSADKATNKAMSAAMKYACLMAFQIPTEGDNDADAHHPEPALRKASPELPPADVDAIVEGYIASVDKAPDTKTLMSLYATLQGDQSLPSAAKTYVLGCFSAKRKQLEGKAA